MTAAQLAFWRVANRRAQSYIPEMAAAFLRALQAIVDAMPAQQLARIIATGNIDTIFTDLVNDALFARAMAPVQGRIRSSIENSFRYVARTLPLPVQGGGVVAIRFDILNPRVIDAIRGLETRVIQSLTDDVRGTVRAMVEQGLRDGVGPRVIAQDLRQVIGLGPSQLQQVQNFRAALEGRDGRSVTNYTLRDQRFKAPQTPAQVDRQVAAYLKRRIAQNAETQARTASLDAMKLGQRLSWQDAVGKGVVDGDRLMHQWIGVNDARERSDHVAMNNEVQPWQYPYSNGELIPGESTYNCRCMDRFFLSREAR